MSKTQLVGETMDYSGVFMEIHRQVGDGSLVKRHLQALTEHRNPFPPTDVHGEWESFYRKYFRIRVDFSDVVIPEDPGDFARIIFIPKGLTLATIIRVMREKFRVSQYAQKLDDDVVNNVRVPDKNYAIRIRQQKGAGYKLKNDSVDVLRRIRPDCQTLLERLVDEFRFFIETEGKHMDMYCEMLCAGSHRRDGEVPSVQWLVKEDTLYIGWCSAVGAQVILISRQVVTN